MDSYRMNCRNVSGNCRNRTCGNMTGNRESMIPMVLPVKPAQIYVIVCRKHPYRNICRSFRWQWHMCQCRNSERYMNLPVDFSSEQFSRNFVNHFVEKEADAGDDGTK